MAPTGPASLPSAQTGGDHEQSPSNPRPPGLLVLPDTTPGVGLGHLARSLALAEEWTRRGGLATVAAELTDPTWLERCLESGARLVESGPWEPADFAWAVFDGYDLHPALQARARICQRLAAVDDHGRSRWTVPVDLVVDPNVGATGSGHVETLVGPRYALLRRDVLAHVGATPRERCVVIVAGGDPPADVVAWMDGVAAALPDDIHPDVIRGGRDLPAAMASAELVVTAASTGLLEAFALGRPVLGFTWVDNQRPGAEHLAAAGALIMGDIADLPSAAVAARAAELLDDAARLSELARLGQSIVDGRGARRVVTRLLADVVTLRPAGDTDMEQLWVWANEPGVRAAAFWGVPIPWDEHVRWMTEKLADPLTDILIGSWEGRSLGQVRFDRLHDTAQVDVSIAPPYRGRGLGGPLIAAATDWYLRHRPSVRSVQAAVRVANGPSHAAFLDADYGTDGGIGEFPAPHLRYSRYRNDAEPHQ